MYGVLKIANLGGVWILRVNDTVDGSEIPNNYLWDVFETLYIMGFQLPFPQLVIAGFLNHQQYVMQYLKNAVQFN